MTDVSRLRSAFAAYDAASNRARRANLYALRPQHTLAPDAPCLRERIWAASREQDDADTALAEFVAAARELCDPVAAAIDAAPVVPLPDAAHAELDALERSPQVRLGALDVLAMHDRIEQARKLAKISAPVDAWARDEGLAPLQRPSLDLAVALADDLSRVLTALDAAPPPQGESAARVDLSSWPALRQVEGER
jgi:hypothetical protein